MPPMSKEFLTKTLVIMPSDGPQSAKKPRDTRSHAEKLNALREAFGLCKERANQSGSVNECSITKVAAIASVPKLYLTGNKTFADEKTAKSYRLIGEEIIQFREDFKKNKTDLTEVSEIESLRSELKNVKTSVYRYFLESETVRHSGENVAKALSEAEKRIVLLQAKLAELTGPYKHGQNGLPTISTKDRLVRTIISPDDYFVTNGEYRFFDDELRHKAWLRAYDDLELALARSYQKRLYILVGLPCSGKSTWARQADLPQDRHPIIFDATNILRHLREDLLHRVKRFDGVRRCCVYFDTSRELIMSRHLSERHGEKRLSEDMINKMFCDIQLPDPYKESWIDEMIIVRAFP